MTTRTTSTSVETTASRRVVGLVVALWLSLGMQPCAIAAETDHDCPHCPPTASQEMAALDHAHHGSDSERGASEADATCASMQSDCCDAGAVSVDGRAGQLKLDSGGDWSPAVAPSWPDIMPRFGAHAASSVDPPATPGTSTPLHVLYCVYLD